MATSITFTAVIIRPKFNMPFMCLHRNRDAENNYWLDGRRLYDNLYYTETASIDISEAPAYARDFLRRMVVDYQWKENDGDENLSGHLLTWRWNGQHQADDYYYPSGQYAECTWVHNGKVDRVELDKDLLDLIEIEMMRQSDMFYYGAEIADNNYQCRIALKK